MKKAALFLFLLLPLASCSSKRPFSFSNLGDLPNFDRNGDLLLMEKEKLPYYTLEDVSKPIDLEQIQKKVETDEDFFLLYSQPAKNCSFCASLEPKFTEFCFDSKLEVFSHKPTMDDPLIHSFIDLYPDGDLKSLIENLATPVIHFIDVQDKIPVAKKIDFYDSIDNVDHFESFMQPLFNLSSIYRFRSFSAFSSFKEPSFLVYFDLGDPLSSSFYHEHIQKQAKSHDKPFAYLETDFFSEEDLSSFLTYFGIEKASHYLIKVEEGKSPTLVPYDGESLDQALSLLSSYYGN